MALWVKKFWEWDEAKGEDGQIRMGLTRKKAGLQRRWRVGLCVLFWVGRSTLLAAEPAGVSGTGLLGASSPGLNPPSDPLMGGASATAPLFGETAPGGPSAGGPKAGSTPDPFSTLNDPLSNPVANGDPLKAEGDSSPTKKLEPKMPAPASGSAKGGVPDKKGIKAAEKPAAPIYSGYRATFNVIGAFAVGPGSEGPPDVPPDVPEKGDSKNGPKPAKKGEKRPEKANAEWKKLILFDTGSDTQSPKIMLKSKAGADVKGPRYTPFVVIKGKLQKKYKSVLFNNVALVVDAKDRFSIEVELTKSPQEVTLRTVLDNGRVQEVRAEVSTNYWGEIVRSQSEGPPSRLFLGIDTQGTVANYSQTGVIPIQQVALTGKFSISYVLFPSVLDVGFSGYYTLAPLVVQPPTRSIRFLGLNFRVGYQLPIKSSRWTFKLLGGYYYVTSFPATNDYGYQNVGGPQLFPTLSFRVGSSTVLSTYFKFSPISSGLGLLSLSSYEMATGLGVAIPLKILRPSDGLFAGFDYSVLQLTLPGGVFFLSTYNLGVGYRIGF